MILAELLLITVALWVACNRAIYLSSRVSISNSDAYWFAWTILLLSGAYCEFTELLDYPVSQTTYDLVLRLHAGATLGILAAAVVGPRSNKPQWINERDCVLAEAFIQSHFRLILGIVGTVAAMHLAENIATMGASAIYGNLIFDLRVSGLNRELSLIGWVSSYLQGACLPLSVLLARADRLFGVRPYRLMALIGVAAIHGFGLGGRGYLAASVITYLAAIAVGRIPKGKLVPPGWRKVAPLGLLMLVVFVLLGSWRGEVSGQEKESFQVQFLNLPLGWIGSSVAAIGPASETYSEIQMNGRLVFEGLSSLIEKSGLLQGETKAVIAQERQVVGARYGNVLANIPPTIIPFLIGDFGSTWMPLYMAFVMGGCQLIGLAVRPSSVLAHSIKVMILVGCFMTIQANLIFTAINIISAFWAWVMDSVAKNGHDTRSTNKSLRLHPTSSSVRTGGVPGHLGLGA
jgi:hypothetical protein